MKKVKKSRVIFFLSVFMAYALFCPSLGISSNTSTKNPLFYQSITQQDKLLSEWNITANENAIHIEGKNREGTTKMVLSPEDMLEKFSYRSPLQGNYSILKQGQAIRATFSKGSKIQTKIFPLNNLPWVQSLCFGLKPFLKSSKTTFKFFIFHSASHELHKMVATKEQVEMIEVNGQKRLAQKVHITLDGIKKHFWKAEAWYDVKTYQQLLYKANEGPKTPVTITTLLNR
jgi:hypothetical protein